MANAASENRRSHPLASMHQPRVLVVDADYEHTSRVSGILEKAGYEVRNESKVEHGLRAIKEERFDVVLMEYRFDRSAITMTAVIGDFQAKYTPGSSC